MANEIIKREFDASGNTIYCEYADGFWYKQKYDAKNNEIYYQNSTGFWWKREYDDFNNETYFESSRGECIKRKYDNHNNQIYYEDNNGYWWKKEYDENGNETYLENSNGYWKRREYDDRNNETYFEDSTGCKEGDPVNKELLYAIKVAVAIIEDEDFSLEVSEISADELGTTNALVFNLVDEQKANLGDIEGDCFDDLNGVLDRMDTYHDDYFFEDLETRLENNENVPADDFTRKCIIFLQSDYCFNLLEEATPSLYSDCVPTGFGFNVENKIEQINLDEALDFLVNKSIAKKILKTLSAYTMVEVEDKIYLSSYGFADNFSSSEAAEEALLQKIKNKEDFYKTYNSYNEFLLSQLPQIKNDIEDLGFDDFYLTNYELQYLGISN